MRVGPLACGACSYTYDAANRLTSVGGVAYTWDDNGNLTYDGVRSVPSGRTEVAAYPPGR